MRQTMKNHQQGLSIIELMIAMTIGLLIMAGLANLFVQSKQSFRQDNLISRMQEDSRFAMDQLSRDVAMAGFFGPMESVSINNGGALPAGAPFDTYGNPVFALDNIAGTPALDWTGALDDAVAGTDAISIRRVLGDPQAIGDVTAGFYYLETNGQSGVMIAASEAPTGIANAEYWEYAPSIWYVRSYCRNGDDIPSLVRRYWDGAAVVTDCIAAGIEDLQIEYGLDTDGDLMPNAYRSQNIDATNSQQLASVRIHMLSRSASADQNYDNTRTYTIANSGAYTPADKFYRRVYVTTVQTRNPTGFRALSYTPPPANSAN